MQFSARITIDRRIFVLSRSICKDGVKTKGGVAIIGERLVHTFSAQKKIRGVSQKRQTKLLYLMLYYKRAIETAKPARQHVDAGAQSEDEKRAVEERHVILEVGLPRVGGRAGEPQRRDRIPEIISNR